MPLLQRVSCSTAIAIGVAIAALAGPAHAQPKNFPNKPVRFLTTGPGSQNDLLARLITAKLSESRGQPVVIENRTRAGGDGSSGREGPVTKRTMNPFIRLVSVLRTQISRRDRSTVP